MGPLFGVGLSQTQVWRFLPLRLWTPRWCLPLTTASGQPRSLLWRTQWHCRVSLPARLRVSRASRKSLRRLPGLLVVTLSLRVCLWPPGRLLAGAPFLDSIMGCFIIFVMLSILSLNCNGIRNRSKRVGLVQWLPSLPVGADVVCLQQTHCLSSSECSSWFLSSGFSAVASPGSSHSCGCIVFFVLRCLWSTLGVMFPVVTCRLYSLSSVALFGFVLCTHLTATLRGTNYLGISNPRSIP